MFAYTDTKISPWLMVDADDKKRARLNCIHHLLSSIPYKELEQPEIVLPERHERKGYIRPPLDEMTYVPEVY